MAPVITQVHADGSGGVLFGNLELPYNNDLSGGNALFAFGCLRPGNCPTFSFDSLFDSLTNSWTQLPVDNTSGNAFYGLGYSLDSSSGPDTVSFTSTGSCFFDFDPCMSLLEIEGVTSFGSIVTTNGASSPPSGSITTPIGTFTFTGTTSHSLWWLSLVYLESSIVDTGIILAIPYVGDAFSEDTVTGWGLLSNSVNLHSGIYTTVSAPPPPTKVGVFVSVGNTRTT